ncbi:unnamed protein product [Parascedosporium putredinis]|uniref:Uncharacterized protein n=1 Tax=Parascedosporium putredinis TaxID=1442378 RepID=A0A9P1H4V2_9PEZI|nr:unnamed protein product [Parascedosporium putredinis]CAI7996299.1 unnamed protein product [Parascedosporium putredinis]
MARLPAPLLHEENSSSRIYSEIGVVVDNLRENESGPARSNARMSKLRVVCPGGNPRSCSQDAKYLLRGAVINYCNQILATAGEVKNYIQSTIQSDNAQRTEALRALDTSINDAVQTCLFLDRFSESQSDTFDGSDGRFFG